MPAKRGTKSDTPSHFVLSYLQLMVIVKGDSIPGTKTKQILREVKGLSKMGVNSRRLAHNLFLCSTDQKDLQRATLLLKLYY